MIGLVYEFAYHDFDLARSFYEEALGMSPEPAIPARDLGRLFKKTGDDDRAREYLERALVLNPNDQKSRALLKGLDAAG